MLFVPAVRQELSVLSVLVQLPPDCADVPSDKPAAEAPPGHTGSGGATKDSGREEEERHSLLQAAGGGGRKGGEPGESDEYEEGRQAALAARAGARPSNSPPAG